MQKNTQTLSTNRYELNSFIYMCMFLIARKLIMSTKLGNLREIFPNGNNYLVYGIEVNEFCLWIS